MEPSDETLMWRMASGMQDQEALAALMDRHRDRLWRFLCRMCRSDAAAEDVWQETWTRVFRHRRSFNQGHDFKPWLYRIAVNCCRSAARTRRRRPAEPLLYENDLSDPSPPPGPLAALIHREEQLQLHQSLDSLPRSQRAVVSLYLFYSTDYASIARVLGKRPASVRADMHRALRKLRPLLNSTGQKATEVCHDARMR